MGSDVASAVPIQPDTCGAYHRQGHPPCPRRRNNEPVDVQADLGNFLRTRRARVSPEGSGLVGYGGRRRVPGLRREELAQLAGISAAYYTRLEQGQSRNASEAVLDAIARVLRLDEGETAHLHTLARATSRARRRARPEKLRASLRIMIDALDPNPAMVIGRCADVLAWNRTAHALLAGHLEFTAPQRAADRPNLARLVFLDPHTKELYVDWPRKTRDAVAYLRLSAGRFPDDTHLTALVGELSIASPEFAALWAAHPVRDCAANTRNYHHPLVGTLALTDELLRLPDDHGQGVVIFTAEPNSPSAAALALLADTAMAEHPAAIPNRRAEFSRGLQ